MGCDSKGWYRCVWTLYFVHARLGLVKYVRTSQPCFMPSTQLCHIREKSCTYGPRGWGQQGSVATGKALFAPGAEIDFTNPAKKRTGQPSQAEKVAKRKYTVPPVTAELTKLFYETLKNTGLKPALLSVLPGYCKDYIPKQVGLSLPKPLTELFYKAEHRKLSHPDLMAECEKAFSSLTVTQEQVK